MVEGRDNLKRRIFHIFTKTHGLSLQTSARKFLENDFLLQGNVKPDEVDSVLDIIASALSSRSGKQEFMHYSIF